MFEISVALKYLLPRWRQLSVSIISLISIVVIALVVWLIDVFFSVTQGLEKSWIQKLIALTAPIRISPTAEYYSSFYYKIDGISYDANYTTKTIEEKRSASSANPYDETFDEEIPLAFPLPDLNQNGELKDLVKLAYQAIEHNPGVTTSEYEMTGANLRLNLSRGLDLFQDAENENEISQGTYLGNYDVTNPVLSKILLEPTKEDLNNLIQMTYLSQSDPSKQIAKIFESIDTLDTRLSYHGWQIESGHLPKNCELEVCAAVIGGKVQGVYIPESTENFLSFWNDNKPENLRFVKGTLKIEEGAPRYAFEEAIHAESPPLIVEGGQPVRSTMVTESVTTAKNANDLRFQATAHLQNVPIEGEISWGNLLVEGFKSSNWLGALPLPESLPSDLELGDAILLPKSYRDAGVLLGDRGSLSFQTASTTHVQEQQVPIFVAGFYDPGILPMGGKIALVNPHIVRMIRASYPREENALFNGINVRFDNLDDAESIKSNIEQAFREHGIDQYWKVETFREYDFSRDILQQLRSERNLFTLIASVILIVACSNIVSMLIILVNDKKVEIGILRSMGASSTSIGFIFGLCGMIMGLSGSIMGIVLAFFTLQNLQALINLISRLQGFEMFNPLFFGDTMPNELSIEVLILVVSSTAVVSLISGVVPACKACLLRPSTILRSE